MRPTLKSSQSCVARLEAAAYGITANQAQPAPTRTCRPALEIRPHRGLLALDLAAVWRYRELLYFLVLRELKVRYKQAALGAAWAIVQPLFAAIIFTVVFGMFATESGIDRHIRFGHRVVRVEWSSADNRWIVQAERADTGEDEDRRQGDGQRVRRVPEEQGQPLYERDLEEDEAQSDRREVQRGSRLPRETPPDRSDGDERKQQEDRQAGGVDDAHKSSLVWE